MVQPPENNGIRSMKIIRCIDQARSGNMDKKPPAGKDHMLCIAGINTAAQIQYGVEFIYRNIDHRMAGCAPTDGAKKTVLCDLQDGDRLTRLE